MKTVITFETPSGTEWRAATDPRHFIPNMFVEISDDNLKAKLRGMESYQFEKRSYPHPRSPKALTNLAESRGNSVGKNYAEAFNVVRTICD